MRRPAGRTAAAEQWSAGKENLSQGVRAVPIAPHRHGRTTFGAGRAAGKDRIAVGYDGNFMLVDLMAKTDIEPNCLQHKFGWSPFNGKPITGWPMATIIRSLCALPQRPGAFHLF
jgi:dihydroorotase-like cyclic amidohydrolase